MKLMAAGATDGPGTGIGTPEVQNDVRGLSRTAAEGLHGQGHQAGTVLLGTIIRHC